MRCIAFGIDGYTAELAQAFAAGARRHGVKCEVRSSIGKPPRCDVVWMYGMHACEQLFNCYEGSALRVVGDLGYWRDNISHLPMQQRHVRISINAQQPDAHLRLRRHPPDRFNALGLSVEPVERRGEYVLVCGHDPLQAERHGIKYGQWERCVLELLSMLTMRSIVLREKPGCPRIRANVPRDSHASIGPAIRAAHAVVCLTGNVGADAILHGVPCFAGFGPGAIYEPAPLNWIDDAVPMSAARRTQALSDLAYCQWTPEEFASGDLWKYLRDDELLP